MIIADFGKCRDYEAIAVLPVYAYYSQLMLIRKEKSTGTFSIYVCAILLISNILRIFFWLTVGFAKSLLIQSILVIAIMVSMLIWQLMLLKECVELQDHFIQHTSIWEKFWKWDTYQEYMRFLMWFTGALIVATLALQVFTFGFFGQLLGLLSLSIQAILGVPQLVANWRAQSVKGVSRVMITMWFLGDFGKTIYFLTEAQPFQFIMCGAIQLTIDILLIAQLTKYGDAYDSLDNSLPE